MEALVFCGLFNWTLVSLCSVDDTEHLKDTYFFARTEVTPVWSVIHLRWTCCLPITINLKNNGLVIHTGVNTSSIKVNKWINNHTWDVLKNLDQAARVYIKKFKLHTNQFSSNCTVNQNTHLHHRAKRQITDYLSHLRKIDTKQKDHWVNKYSQWLSSCT